MTCWERSDDNSFAGNRPRRPLMATRELALQAPRLNGVESERDELAAYARLRLEQCAGALDPRVVLLDEQIEQFGQFEREMAAAGRGFPDILFHLNEARIARRAEIERQNWDPEYRRRLLEDLAVLEGDAS